MHDKVPIELLLLTNGKASQQEAPVPKPSSSPDDRNEAYRATEGGGVNQSGTLLLTEAYAAIWLLVFVMIVRSMRKQTKLDARIDELRKDIAAARDRGAADGQD